MKLIQIALLLFSALAYGEEPKAKQSFSYTQTNGKIVEVRFINDILLNMEPGCINFQIEHLKHDIKNEKKIKIILPVTPFTFDGERDKKKVNQMKGKIYIFKFKEKEITEIIETK